MLGFVIIYFLGRSLYRLAETHGRSPWGHAIGSVLMYYVGTFLAGIAFFLLADLNGGSIEDTSDMAINLAAVPFGLAAWYGYKAFFKHRWENAYVDSDELELLDSELLRTDREE